MPRSCRPIDQLAVPKRPPNIAILASDGTLLANRGETGGRTVALKELPPYLPKAFVAIEDRRFYDHFGIDPVGIGRAVMRNLNRGGVTQGGSTLTQQLAKNLFLTQERTASRKIQEAILALWLERTYSKDQILELYLNRVYFGAGAYGVEAAAQRYFGKSAREVTPLPRRPCSPASSRRRRASRRTAIPTRRRRAPQLVLAAMGEQGFVRPDQMKAALTAPAKAAVASKAPARPTTRPISSWTCSTISSARSTATSSSRPPSIPCCRPRPSAPSSTSSTPRGRRFNVEQGALVAMRPDGAVKALVGGRDYAESQFNRATAARRQPGSAFKPFVYLAAIERGLTPDTVREDAPVAVKGWRPENYTREYRGPVTLRDALALRSTRSPFGSASRSGRRPSCRRRSASAFPRRCRPTPRSRSAPRR